MRLIFLGPPGAGKGSQAALLSKKLHIAHLCTGDLLRNEIKKQTDLGKQVQPIMDQGLLVPDDVIIEVTMRNIYSAGFILDGFPRTLVQAEALQKGLEEKAMPIEKVIFINTSEEVIINRLAQRRSCEGCGAVYNLVSHPPIIAYICNKCSGKLIARPDDDPATIKVRQERYREQTKPLLTFYADKLFTVDGSKPLEEVEKAIMEAVNLKAG